MPITQKRARALLGDRLILQVDPRRLTHEINNKKPIAKRLENWLRPAPRALRKAVTLPLRKNHPFIIGSGWFPDTTPFESLGKYRKVRDLFDNRSDFRRSQWYATLDAELRAQGVARHKTIVMHSDQDIIDFFDHYVGELIRSMERDGYIEGRGVDIGTAMIGHDGTLYKGSSGSHRFYTARLLGTARVPVRVSCVHRGWLDSLGLPATAEGLEQLGEPLREVEQRYR
ncbi:hypothetical protein LY622_19535 [Halomonas sp. M5N1S17]|uniref:hypothetical protein n=1 Tax=Halomonas alkalisoli TaxID=2907158 RepID=UPI001F474CCD|nr:hypothetical protein [Halomonas alkalisoli]MCE9665618.1 hypothetical protein [Halomonas alkalisoli]